tara:strand:+ start:375 stop:986 length:612 start_codon:yes stop_codon:yes gene_type:complete
MLDNITIININELNLSNLQDKNNNTILIDYISNTLIFDNITTIKLPHFKNSTIIGTNITYYFGFNKLIINYINKQHIPLLLSNIYNKHTNTWSDIIVNYYNLYKDKYQKKNLDILNNLLNNLQQTYIKIYDDYILSLTKIFDLDVANKALIEFFESNISIILHKFFDKIKLFYILSIILSPHTKNYTIIYNSDIINSINKLLK